HFPYTTLFRSELPAHSRLPLKAFLQRNLAAPYQVEGVPLGLLQVGIDANRLPQVGTGPALSQLDGALVPEGRPPQPHVATLGGVDGVGGAAETLHRGFPVDRGRHS